MKINIIFRIIPIIVTFSTKKIPSAKQCYSDGEEEENILKVRFILPIKTFSDNHLNILLIVFFLFNVLLFCQRNTGENCRN